MTQDVTWIKNTGTMPENITAETIICVKYVDGVRSVSDEFAKQCYWQLDGSACNIAEYYIVKQ